MAAKPEEKRQLGRYGLRCECNFKIYPTGMRGSELD